MDVDDSFYHHVVDPGFMRIANDKYWALVIVTCDGVQRPYAFSNCGNGCPLFPDNSVKIARNRIQVCEGDTIFVGSDQCTLGKIKKEPWPKR